MLTYGDSKTRMVVGASNNESLWQIGFQFFVRCRYHFNVGSTVGTGWLATNGVTVAGRASTVAADLAAVTVVPAVVMFNLGSNDAYVGDAAEANEAYWKTQANALFDALHAKWPNARIYYSETWRRGYDTESDRLATWYAAVVAGRSYVTLCDNERDWMKGADDGATMSWDGIHFSVAGSTHKARLAAGCLGF